MVYHRADGYAVHVLGNAEQRADHAIPGLCHGRAGELYLRSVAAVDRGATTGPQWGLTFSYDGFGNGLSQVATKGTAPTVYSSYDTANHIMNYIHDGNGNITWLPNGTTLAYDVENRVTAATVSGRTETYYYAPDGRRVYRKATDGTEYMYFYGVQGERLPYQMGSYVGQLTGTPPAYFAGRRLGWGATADRLGSVRVAAYYPYGEYEGTPQGDDVRFATYVRDSATGLDYAVNRYYSSIIGRFLSPDPYRAGTGTGDLREPQSWNRYAYVGNDPVNFNDISGLNKVLVPTGGDCSFDGESMACAASYGIVDTGGATINGDIGGGGSKGSEFPECNPKNDPLTEKELRYITADYKAALSVATSVVSSVSKSAVSTGGLATLFVQWSMWESGYNSPMWVEHVIENNAFGQQVGWPGSVPCPSNSIIPSNSKNACFSMTWGDQLAGALSATHKGVSYLTALQRALPTATAAQDLQAIANNGWNADPGYGKAITGINIQSLVDCALKNNYIK
jgi:RHS repeat-associated protein